MTATAETDTRAQRLFWLTVAIATLVTLGIWGYGFIAWGNAPNKEEAGQRGDSFGAITSLFNAFAFLGVIVTIWLQKEELEEQRREIRENRRELERTANAQEVLARAVIRQAQIAVYSAKLASLPGFIEAAKKRIALLDRNKFPGAADVPYLPDDVIQNIELTKALLEGPENVKGESNIDRSIRGGITNQVEELLRAWERLHRHLTDFEAAQDALSALLSAAEDDLDSRLTSNAHRGQ